jgi:hypothetical protein
MKKKILAGLLIYLTGVAGKVYARNVGIGTPKDLAESMFRTIQREHRYLQNEFFTALWHFFKLYGAQDENHRDARNEWAVQVSKRWEKATFD